MKINVRERGMFNEESLRRWKKNKKLWGKKLKDGME